MIAVFLGFVVIIVALRRMIQLRSRLATAAARKLCVLWLGSCCFASLILFVTPASLELFGILPYGSFGIIGAVLFFVYVVRSGLWYRRRMSGLAIRGKR
jgi:hypothetical protein